MASSSDTKHTAQRGYLPPQNAEEQLLQRRVEELCRAVQFRGQPRYTDFLSDRQQQLAQAALHRAGWSSCRWEGGYPQAERKILCILSDLDAPCEPPIQAVRITPREKSVRLQHRDCLGALLGLGLDRAGLGDLLPEEDGSMVAFCQPTVSRLIVDELRQVGRADVTVQLCEDADWQPYLPTQLCSATVASLRLDAVLAAMLHCSREQAADLIRTGKVQVGHVEVSSAHLPVYQDDVITVRGKGRFRLQEIGGKSRKDRIFIHYQEYI